MSEEFPKPVLPVAGGNIFGILSAASELLKKYYFTDQGDRIKEMQSRVYKSESYDDALDIIGEYVKLEGI